MSKIVLLHGFAVGLTAPIVRSPFGPSASMSAFDKQVKTGDATVFPWGIRLSVQPWELLSLSQMYTLYRDEFDLIHSETLHEQLKQFLDQQQPAVIVCHSMGCTLLQLYLERHTLPSSVKSIILIQSDQSTHVPFRTTAQIYHLYCPWDPTLLLSSIANRSIRAGLKKSKQPHVINILFPLTRLPNLHTSSIRDKKLVALVDSITTNK